ncbi:hypothetical protein ACFL2C_00425 [Patescibacteria group bacterium]
MSKQSKIGATSKGTLLMLVGLVAALLLSFYLLTYNKETRDSSAKNTAAVNEALSDPHYSLNLVGVPKGKTAAMKEYDDNKIFLPTEGNCQINLSEGDFQVQDANCIQGPAAFRLPNSDPDNDGETVYSVWVKTLGKPGGSSSPITCGTDSLTGQEWCSIHSMVSVRKGSKGAFSDASRELLNAYVDTDIDGKTEKHNVFSSAFQDYFWNYDSDGLKQMQLRFYVTLSSSE